MDTLTPYLKWAQSSNALSVAASAGALVFAILAYRDYRDFVALGPTGLPNTFRGWMIQVLATSRSRSLKETMVPAPYSLPEAEKIAGPNAARSFLSRPLQPRKGARPELWNFVAPQRQKTQLASDDYKKRMTSFLDALIEENKTFLQKDLSRLEGPVPALQLRQSLPEQHHLNRTRQEMAHIHPPDGSTHVLLSLADSQTVIKQGWGQRHRLCGPILPWGYTLIYAPRDESEMEIWRDLVVAAVKYCSAEVGEVKEPAGKKF